jgi:hypothetical protein
VPDIQTKVTDPDDRKRIHALLLTLPWAIENHRVRGVHACRHERHLFGSCKACSRIRTR